MKKLLLLLTLIITIASITPLQAATAPTQGEIAKLYIATFNRAPDAAGLNYWTDEANKGMTIESMAKFFFNSSEVQVMYPPGSTTRDFVDAVYRNLFNRASDPGGLEYWVGVIDKGIITRSVFILYAINTDSENDAMILENKTEVALAFVEKLGAKSNITGGDLASDPAYLASIKIISVVTIDPVTVAEVLSFLESIKGNDDPISDILNGHRSNIAILSLVTQLKDANLTGVLSSNQKSKLRFMGLEDSSIKLKVTTSRDSQIILPTSISIETQSITFTSPVNITAGNLSVVDILGNILTAIPYKIVTAQTPYLKEVTPDIVNAGESVTLSGGNLPSALVQVVFEGQDSSLTQTVTPSGSSSVSFTVPQSAASGSIYLQINQVETNRLQLSIKKEIEALVVLGEGVNIKASDISFVLGLEAFTLNENNRTRLSVENKDMDYINAIAERPDKEPALLYMAVILPNMNGTIEINAHSTAIAWVMMGMGASIVTPRDQWQSLYEHIASDTKVQEFADYIDILQKSDFDAWAALSDKTLKEKFQDALTSVVQTQIQTRSIAARSMTRDLDSGSTIIIRQTPDNSGIYVDDYKYFSEINTGYRLNNGNVNVINDTRLYLSVEVRDSEEGAVVNGYSHYDAGREINKKSFIAPQGWAITNFSSLTELSLEGTDSIIEIIIGASSGETYEEELADDLMTRAWINGVGVPMFNQIVGFIIKKKLDKRYGTDPSHMKRLISGLSTIYEGQFISDLGYELKHGTSYSSIANKILIAPLYNGLSKCATGGIHDSFCVHTLSGIAQIFGMGNTDDILAALMTRMAIAVEDKVIGGAIVSIPVVGWIAGVASVTYKVLGAAANASTIAGTFYDMSRYPREINVEVDFPLEVSDAKPTCLAIESSDTETSILIYGKGFKGDDDTLPGAMLGIDSAGNGIYETKQDPFVNVTGDKMTATFDAQELVGAGSWSNYLYVSMYGANVKYQKEMMRIVSPNDEVVYFDSIEPQSAYRGATVTLKGCGWVPLNDIKVYFNKEGSQDYIEGEVLSGSTVDTIKVKVPDTARSGAVYVTTGNKETKKLLFDINPFSLEEPYEEQALIKNEGSWESLSGHELAQASKVYFTDHTGKKIEGSITQSDEYSLNATIPKGLAYGKIQIYAENEDGIVTNEIALPLVPAGVDANPPSQSFLDSITVSLTQEDNVDIFYRIEGGEEQRYTEPITLNADEAEFEYYSIHTVASVTVNGVDYNSTELEYTYTPIVCKADEELVNGECVSIFAGHSCPMIYDPLLDDDPSGAYTPTITIKIRDKDRNGEYEDYRGCLYYHTEQLMYETPYLDNSINGIQNGYYKSGQIWLEIPYLDNLKNGIEKKYYESGQISIEIPYLDNSKNGIQIQYYESGQIMYKIPYLDNSINGIEKRYYESGQIWIETPYVTGVKHGNNKFYSSSGTMTECRIYNEGTNIGSCM